MATKKKQSSKRVQPWRIIASFALLVAAVGVLFTHRQIVADSLKVLRHASIGWLVTALVLTALTYVIAATIYTVLALRPLRYLQTLLVEVSTAFVNRLLPSGIGGLGLHGDYLYRRKHTVSEATVVVSVNNVIGMVAHLSLLIVVLFVRPEAYGKFHFGKDRVNAAFVAGAIVLVVMVLFSIPNIRHRFASLGHNLLQSVCKVRLSQLLKAYSLALLLTATYTAILYASVHAVGLHLNILQVFVAFSVGMLAATATPTPGGLVGAEAGLYLGLIGYGAAIGPAGAVVLLYRLVTYWLPLLPGLAALAVARRQQLV